MALQSIKGGTWLPNRPPHLNAALSIAAVQLDTTDEKLAFVVQSPPRPIDPITGNPIKIAKIGFSVTANSGGNSYDIRLERVDAASGQPNGSLWSTGTNVVQSLGLNWITATLGTQADVPIGEFIAIVIARQSGGAYFATVSSASCAQEFPYTCHYNGGTWTKLQNGPVCALEFENGSYQVIQGAWPIKAIANTSFNSSGVNQRGLRVKLPFPAQAVGAWVWAKLDGDAWLKLYNNFNPSSPAELASVTLDKDYRYGATYGRQVYYFNNPVVLNQDAEYFLALSPTSATSVFLNEVEVNAASLLDAMDGGQNLHLVTRSGTNQFTGETTKRPMMGLILDQFPGNLGYFDVTTFGAKGDGNADDTTAIQAAITAAGNAPAGSTVFIPRGTYLCQGIDLNDDELRLIGDGTLKLKNASNAHEVLEVSGDHCFVSGIRIDGNRGGSPTGLANGLYVSGNYGHVLGVTVFNTKTGSGSANVLVGGSHTLVEQVWSYDAGGAAFRDSGNYNRFQNVTAQNWGYAGFYRPGVAIDRLDIDGGYFEPGEDSVATNCLLFDGANPAKMVAIRNTVVNWGVTPSSNTLATARFTQTEQLILDNCQFQHPTKEMVSVEIGAGVKRAYFDHTFLSRQLKLNSIDSDAVMMLVDTQIGSDALWTGGVQPTISVLGVKGAQFIARACRFIGYTEAALELIVDMNATPAFVHFEASDTEFQGRGAIQSTTYDVKATSPGNANASRRILWLNNQSKNTAFGGVAWSIVNPTQAILFTTRDWSKRVLESGAVPSATGVNWQVGDTSMNTGPTSPNGNIGWVCTTGGQPATWKTFGTIT